MPYFMVSNYGGLTRDVCQLIMEVGVTKLYIGVFSFLKGVKKIDTEIVVLDVAM